MATLEHNARRVVLSTGREVAGLPWSDALFTRIGAGNGLIRSCFCFLKQPAPPAPAESRERSHRQAPPPAPCAPENASRPGPLSPL